MVATSQKDDHLLCQPLADSRERPIQAESCISGRE
jgi:hypothetical protein